MWDKVQDGGKLGVKGGGEPASIGTPEMTRLGRRGRERAWVSAGIRVLVIPPHGARYVAIVYVYTLMDILSAMTSGSMPIPLTSTLLAGSRRLDTSCSPPKVRPSWVGYSEGVALRPIPSFLWSPFPFPIAEPASLHHLLL